MADYQLTETDQHVIRTADKAWVPNNLANRDWVEYQTWLAVPNIPDPYIAPPPQVPPLITAFQFWMQAHAIGKVTENFAIQAIGGNLPPSIDAWINTLPIMNRFRARMFFRGAVIPRIDNLVGLLGTFWAVDMDQFFRDASLV